MAGIDKTYTDSWEDYKEFVDWAKDRKINFWYGNKKLSIDIGSYIWEYDKEAFDGTERPIMNTPTWYDKYLYDNCPCDFVRQRLNQVYPDDYLKTLEIGKIPNEFEQNRKITVTVNERTKLPLTNKGLSQKTAWCLQTKEIDFWYSDSIDAWVHRESLFPHSSNTMYSNTVKSMVRRLRKMYLPSGLEFRLRGRYIGEEFTVKIK